MGITFLVGGGVAGGGGSGRVGGGGQPKLHTHYTHLP